MLPLRNPARLSIVLVLTILLAGFVQAQNHVSTKTSPNATTAGKSLFTTTCAGCHGLDGRGAERAPNIAHNPRVQHLSDSQIARIISDGITGTGMPGFHTLKDEQVRAIVAYLRILEGKQQAQSLPGDAATGQQIFVGKGECSSCHTISGQGGFMGPDLSSYASNLSTKEILQGITNKDRIVPTGYKSAVAVTRDGERVEGIVRNEDNFSVQLQAKDGSFHFFQKTDLQNLQYLGAPLMPTNYAERLTQSELNDLASYLMTASSQGQMQAQKIREDDPE